MLGFAKSAQDSVFVDDLTEKLFTQEAAPELAAIAKGIKGQHSRFTTHFMGLAAEGEEPVKSARLIAWQKPGTELFCIEKISRAQMPGEKAPWVKKEDIVTSGICFFDALRLLSSYQAGCAAAGESAFPANDADNKTVYWQVAAQAAGQSVDASGLVQPCADQRVLTTGVLFKSEEDMLVARQSAPAFHPSQLRVGQKEGDKGIFIGFYNPEEDEISNTLDEKHSLGLFVSPTDVKEKDDRTCIALTFNKMAKHVATLSNWHGHDGAKVKEGIFSSYEKNLKKHLRSLKEGEGTGWFIGTKSIVMSQWLSCHNDKAFASDLYLSCTQCPEDSSNIVALNIHYTGASERNLYKEYEKGFARPVRAERFKL